MLYWCHVTTVVKNLIRCRIKELFDTNRLIISVFNGTIRIQRKIKMDSEGGSTEFSGQFPKHFRKVSTYIYL